MSQHTASAILAENKTTFEQVLSCWVVMIIPIPLPQHQHTFGAEGEELVLKQLLVKQLLTVLPLSLSQEYAALN